MKQQLLKYMDTEDMEIQPSGRIMGDKEEEMEDKGEKEKEKR